MTGKVEARLKALNIALPGAPTPVANYVPTRIVGDLMFVSGQISRTNEGALIAGKLGGDLTTKDGARAARQCGLALLAQARGALGDLDKSSLA